MTASTDILHIAPLVKVGGSDLSAVVLNAMIGLRISSGLRIPSRATLDFLDDGFAISGGSTFTLGAAVTVATADGTALFTGSVTGVQLDVDRGAPNLTVVADDAAYKMTLGNKVRTFTQMTYSDIVSQIAGEYGISGSVASTSGTHEYLLQSDSDFGFITEMADRVGFDWWVDPSGTLQFQPVGALAGTPPTLHWDGGTLRSLSVRATALHPGTVTAMGWDPTGKQPMSVDSTRVPHQPTASLVTPYLQANDLSAKNKVQTADRMYAKQTDGTGFAASVASRSAYGASTATGVCQVNPAIKVGGQVSLTESGPASGTYPVTEVVHTYTSRGFETRFTAGDREPMSLVDTLATDRPSSFRQDSLVVGVVTNVDDPNSSGRVKVKFPTLGSQIESEWARVISIGGGSSRGMTFLPEVNDEVIVGFEGGDISRPLVVGGMYNGQDAALDYGVASGKIAKRQIVSRLGHVIELGDGDGPADQHIWLTLQGGEFFVKLGKDGLTAQVPSGKPVAIAAGNSSIKVDASGNIAVAGQKITITGQQDVEISGLNVKIKGNVNVEASASAQLKLSGSAQAELSAGGQTAVKGAVVMIN